MAFKVVSFFALVLLVQLCAAGKPYYRPSCGCSSGKVSITEIEEIKECTAGKPYYRPSCGCSSGKVSITEIEEIKECTAGKPYYRPSCGYGSGKVTINKIEEIKECTAGKPYYRSNCGYGSGKVTINEIEEIKEVSYKPLYKSPSSCVSIDVPSNGGSLVVTSIGGIAPSGIAVATELGLGGDLVLSGELPYLSAVAFEGQFASAGSVPVSYGCGDIVAITEQIGGSASASGYSLQSAGSYSLPSASYKIAPSCGCSCGSNCGC